MVSHTMTVNGAVHLSPICFQYWAHPTGSFVILLWINGEVSTLEFAGFALEKLAPDG